MYLIRKAFHAGSWYTNKPKDLNSELSQNLGLAVKSTQNLVKALIGPHAGYAYSGPNAAWAYININPECYDRVFILGPSHKVYLDFVATTTCQEWETPIGNLPVDLEIVQSLCKADNEKFS
jgi:AmmeMemoRadiSam system protein B